MTMSSTGDISAAVIHAVSTAPAQTRPFRHWCLDDVLPAATIDEIVALPVPAPAIGDTRGRRETNNATRCYFAGSLLARSPAARAAADAFAGSSVVRAIAATSGADLADTRLRIEYCQDTDGFWLEPHCDIKVKRLTLIVYLADAPAGDTWGTDLYDAALMPAGRSEAARGQGLMFRPGHDTWHGFAPRPIHGVRRSLIVNYVGNDWRDRYELAFPDRPVA
jgi:hypothetical protein